MSTRVERTPESGESLTQFVPLKEVDSPVLREGLTLWGRLCRGRRFPARSDVTARELKTVLRNTTLLRVIDGGKDYEYRIVGDADVMAHGVSFQSKRWSETAKISLGYHDAIKPVYDLVVKTGEPVATRGWIEKGRSAGEHIYCEYVFLPLGMEPHGVDHILVFAVYVARPLVGISRL
ncbi:MAG TPA: PAS domain-containing protein [Rhizomicrobium sp.]|nr:PAS domain-containing protein [Rhizomicrobium sp.]